MLSYFIRSFHMCNFPFASFGCINIPSVCMLFDKLNVNIMIQQSQVVTVCLFVLSAFINKEVLLFIL